MSSPRKALEAFADAEQNPDLLQLERLLSRFNLFEAVGVVRHELRHSDFLAYLLNPGQNHGLGAVFLKGLLQAVLLTTEGDSAVPASDLDVWDLSQVVVQREWHHIDILVVDDVNRFAVLIENKVDSGEHSGQLNRYYAEFRSHHPGYKVVALFLTPDGDAPSSDAYHAVSYTLVCQVIEKIAQDIRATRYGEIVMVLEHYAQMLRRHIVSDSDVAELCRSIYQKHQQALDLIFEHRPGQQDNISQFAKSLVLNQPKLVLYHNRKSYTRFGLEEWSKCLLHSEKNNDGYSNLLYFQFDHTVNRLYIKLEIGPGDQPQREKLFDMARTQAFDGFKPKLSPKYSRIFTRSFLTADDYEKTQEEIETLISDRWAAFLRDDLPHLAQAIRDEKWLWEIP